MSNSSNYQLHICLESDSSFSSGAAFGNLIDTDIESDEAGLPIISARRIKGLLRQAGDEMGFTLGADFQNAVNSAFGQAGSEVQNSARFDNASLRESEEVKEWLKFIQSQKGKDHKVSLNKEAVLSFFTTLRSSTAIDPEGVASDKSLRTIRCLKRGLEFVLPLNCTRNQAEVISVCASYLRRGGTSRNRGYGWIHCEVQSADGDSILEDSMNRWFKE